MGGTKTETKQTQTQGQKQRASTTNTFDHVPGASSADIDAVRGYKFTKDARTPYAFASAKRGIEGVYNNPLGKYTTQGLRDAQMINSYEDLAVAESQANREENYDQQGLEFAKLTDVAAMTAPRFVQTGGEAEGESSGTSTGSSTQTQTQSPLNSIIQGGSAIGSALIM